MKYVFLILIIVGISVIFCLPQGYSDLVAGHKYIIQATGYLSGNQKIFDSTLDIDLTVDNNGNATIDNALVTISGSHYLNSGGWQASVLRNSKYMIIQGDAKDQNGNLIHLNLFGRIIDNNQEGSVYGFTGKIIGSETMKASYGAKIIDVNSIVTSPITIPNNQTQNTQNTTQHPVSFPSNVNINIISGSSNPKNGIFLSPSSIQAKPGTTVTWTNNDSVPHRIMSGQILTTTSGPPHFISDGKIDSDVISPGQHYQTTITNTGSTQFFDPSYTWINGIIISSSTITQGTPVQISIALGSSVIKGTASQQFNQYNTYYYPDTIQIVPGTPIIWVNNDSIDHYILSGVSTQKNGNPFTPDGKIASGKIAPGQSFMYIVNDTGIIRFYDPQYTWMNGLIISMPPSSSITIGAASHNYALH